MTPVKDIMSTELVVVSPELSLRDLVELLANEHLSGAPVVAQGKTVGVVSLDDIVSFQANLSPVPTDGAEEIGWDEQPPPGAVEGEEVAGAFFQDLGRRGRRARGAHRGRGRARVGSPRCTHGGGGDDRRLWTIGPDQAIEAAARRMPPKGKPDALPRSR